MKDGLLSAGAMLAEAIRIGLAAHELPNDVAMFEQDGRVVVGSRSVVVRDAELGRAGVAPRAVMEAVAVEVAPHVLRGLRDRLEGSLR